MYIQILKSKIHRVRVTQANLNYVGSITIDQTLMEAVGILPGERVQVVDCNNGNRLDTYVIAGEPNSGVICLNGPAARLVPSNHRLSFQTVRRTVYNYPTFTEICSKTLANA